MDEKDRDKLTKHCAELVPAINWHEVFPKLINHKIFRKEDKNVQWWEEHLDNESNNRDIYLKIRNRGPKAFEKFVLCLKETGHEELAHLLKPDNNIDYDESQEILNDAPITEDSLLHRNDRYYTQLQYTKTPLKIYLKKATRFMCPSSGQVMCYTMNSNPRGLVLIINNILFNGENLDRSAAEHDENNLKDLFEQMGFRVDIFSNLTCAEMLDTISAFSKRRELRHVHSTFVIIMSHGGEHVRDNHSESVVCGVDDKVVTAQEILNFFRAATCVDMCKKPKVFIFQTCRGTKTQQIVISKTVSMGRHSTDISSFVEPNAPKKPAPMGCRDLSDMLVAYSTLPGHVAHRDKFTGSWYIQTLCEVIMNHAYNTELTRLFQMTDERLSSMHNSYKECQTSVFMNFGFNKECYLNPGLFQDQIDN